MENTNSTALSTSIGRTVFLSLVFSAVIVLGALILAPVEKIKGADKSTCPDIDYRGAIKHLETYAILFMLIGGLGLLSSIGYTVYEQVSK
jgi:hypothetical protein